MPQQEIGSVVRDEPTPAMVRSALTRVVASAAFQASPNLVSFLTYVTEATLTGRGDNLKAYTVATLGLGRGVGFDPRHDPIVRTEARRLRRLLTQYYEGIGRDDPVQIELPLGGYTPRFSTPSAAEIAETASHTGHSVPASAYLTYLATFFLDERALGWPRLRARGGFEESACTYDVAA